MMLYYVKKCKLLDLFLFVNFRTELNQISNRITGIIICALRLPRCTILLKGGDSRYTVERWGWHGLLDHGTLLVRRVGILRCIARADDDGISHRNAISGLGPVSHRVVIALAIGWWISSISLGWVSGSLGRVGWHKTYIESWNLRDRTVRRAMRRSDRHSHRRRSEGCRWGWQLHRVGGTMRAMVVPIEIASILGDGGLHLTRLVSHEDAR